MTTLGCKNMTRHMGIKIQIENHSCVEEMTGCKLEQNLATFKIVFFDIHITLSTPMDSPVLKLKVHI